MNGTSDGSLLQLVHERIAIDGEPFQSELDGEQVPRVNPVVIVLRQLDLFHTLQRCAVSQGDAFALPSHRFRAAQLMYANRRSDVREIVLVARADDLVIT